MQEISGRVELMGSGGLLSRTTIASDARARGLRFDPGWQNATALDMGVVGWAGLADRLRPKDVRVAAESDQDNWRLCNVRGVAGYGY